MGRQIKTVLFVVAMEGEAMPIVEELGLAPDQPSPLHGPSPSLTFSGSKYGLTLHLVTNGKDTKFGVDNVGTAPAALATFLAVQAFRPDLVVSLGTAGGFIAQGAAIGDVFVGTGTLNHDRRIPLPGFDAYGLWEAPCLPTERLRKELGLKGGVVTSGGALTFTKEDMEVMREKKAAVKEMEAGVIAWALQYSGTPLLPLKAVTDLVDGTVAAQKEFLANFAKASQALKEATGPLLQYLSGRATDEL